MRDGAGPAPGEVLDFWFEAGARRWFGSHPAFDRAIAWRFGGLLAAARGDQLEEWRQTPQGALALVIVLDQFARNIGRGTAEAFAADRQALAAARAAIGRRLDLEMPEAARVWFYMPFMHAEDRAAQAEGLPYFAERISAPETLQFARRHAEVIARFGRFPHRNRILGRVSSAAEADFLESGGGFDADAPAPAFVRTGQGVRLACEVYDPPEKTDKAPVLLIRGLGTQLIMWPYELIEGLCRTGRRVVIFDNRDCGLSDRCPQGGYGLADMAADAAGLLDGLKIPAAHVIGISMGGMIAQHMGFGFGPRVVSLTSIMSTTGNRGLSRAAPEVLARVMAPGAAGEGAAAAIARLVSGLEATGSPGFATPPDELRRMARMAYERAWAPEGVARQLRAIEADGDRRQRLGAIGAPALVIHGRDDRLIPPDGGEDTARAIPGARLALVSGMGHDMARGLVPHILAQLAPHLDRSEGGSGDDGDQGERHHD